MNASAATLAVTEITDGDIPAVIALWQACGLTRPWNDPAGDIALSRRGEHSTVLVGRAASTIVATAMVGHDGHRGWVYYVAVDPKSQGKGFGRVIMNAAEDWLRRTGIEKIQLMVRADNKKVQAFYESLDYGEQERIIYAKWLDGRPLTP